MAIPLSGGRKFSSADVLCCTSLQADVKGEIKKNTCCAGMYGNAL